MCMCPGIEMVFPAAALVPLVFVWGYAVDRVFSLLMPKGTMHFWKTQGSWLPGVASLIFHTGDEARVAGVKFLFSSP